MRSNVPYWHRHGVGVAFDREAVRVVALRARPGQVAVVAHGEESIGVGGPEAALARLADRLDVSVPEVATHVRPERLALERAPAFEDAEDLDGWLRSRTVNADPDRIVRAVPLAEQSRAEAEWSDDYARDEGSVCVFAEVGAAEVARRTEALQEVGWMPASVGTAVLELAALLPYADDAEAYLDGPLVIVWCGRASEDTGVLQADVLTVEDGSPVAYAREHAGADVVARSAAALVPPDSRSQPGALPHVPLAVTGPGAETVRHALSDLGRSAAVLRPFGLSADYALAVALAAATLDGGAALDFLSPGDAFLAAERAEKRQAQRFTLGVGATLLLALLLGVGGTSLAGMLLAGTEEKLAGHVESLAALETERLVAQRLEQAIYTATGLASEQTAVTGRLVRVAQALPPSTRLLSLRATPEVVELEGLAPARAGVGEVMAGVEAAFPDADARLVLAERYAGRQLARAVSRSGAPDHAAPSDPAVWFRIDVVLSPLTGGSP